MRDKELKSSKYSLPIFTIAIFAIPALTLFGVCSYFEYQMMQPMPSTLAAIEDLAEIDLPDETVLVCSDQQDGMDRIIEATLSVPGGATLVKRLLEEKEVTIEKIEDLSKKPSGWPNFSYCPLDSPGPYDMYEYESTTGGLNRFLFKSTPESDESILFIGWSF